MLLDDEHATRQTTPPRVRRPEHAEPYGAKQHAVLARLIEEPYHLQADAMARTGELTRRAFEPLQRVVEQDEAAKAAWVALRDHRRTVLEHATTRRTSRTFGGGPVASLIPTLHAGINVFALPFDFQITGPNKGGVTVSSDRFTGTFSISLPWGEGGARFATAGVGLTLETTVTGVAHVRPAWSYDYQAWTLGDLLSSHTEGTGKLVVQDAVTGAVLKDVAAPLWNFDTDHYEDGGGYIDSWSLGADFFVQAGQIFTVSLLATGMVDDSGSDYWFGYSFARAWMEMRVPFVVVELGP